MKVTMKVTGAAVGGALLFRVLTTSATVPVKPTPKLAIPAVATTGAVYYAATNGSNAAPCALTSPCDIAKLNTVLKPGDVGYLRGGVYPGPINISTSGNLTNKIVIQSYPPDGLYAANIECKGVTQWCVTLNGSDTWMMDVRVNDTDAGPRSYANDEASRKAGRPNCVGLFGTRNGFVNGIAENCDVGVSTTSAPQYGAYVYGNLIYYNGMDNLSTRGSGHNTYLQSGADYTDPTEITTVMDNVTHDTWNMGNHEYGESKPTAPHGLLNFIHDVGNTDFANGRTSKRPTQGT